MNNLPTDDDDTTEVETELAGSGRTGVAPREGLVGAHDERREAEGERDEDEPASREPVGAGADVAPTRRAEERERTRHRLQREQGVVPAGTEGNPRQQRAPGASREDLDEAGREADDAVRDTD
jgi:hypothetical protein